MEKNVALVLSSGGPRGFAYIGAIEELLSRGYRIASVAGCSVGSLIGGVYAAGGLENFKEWLYSLDNLRMLRLLDLSISKSYLMKGERLMATIRRVVPEVNIEDMSIPYVAVAADLYTGEQVVFREGPLYDAIRASISIPSMLRPVKWKGRVLVDGGIVNTLPLDLVERTPGDILVAFDVNEIDRTSVSSFMRGKIAEDNYISIIDRCFSIANHIIARQDALICPPDVLVKMPLDEYTSIMDYVKGEEIAEKGRTLMAEALDRYEAQSSSSGSGR